MILEEATYLEHYGVQGMKWGQRKAYNKANVARLRDEGLSRRQAKATNRFQNRVDMRRQAASGRLASGGHVSVRKQLKNRAAAANAASLATSLRHPLSVQKGAQRQLQKDAQAQAKIAAGKKRVTATLLKIGGVSIKNIDFSLSPA